MARGKGGAVGGSRGGRWGRSCEALLDADEVAVHFGVPKTTVYRWCKEERIPCLKIGRFWRVRREALEYFPKKSQEG